eukprot:886048-Pyramimonas_sp.AAC.1
MQCDFFAGSLLRAVTKVTAHQEHNADLPAAECAHIIGNNAADEAAKAGAHLHPGFSDEEFKSFSFLTSVSRAVTKLAANVLYLWPRTDLTGVERTPAAARPQR